MEGVSRQEGKEIQQGRGKTSVSGGRFEWTSGGGRGEVEGRTEQGGLTNATVLAHSTGSHSY